MTDYLTEQEQIEILKNWIKQYSMAILIGILIAVTAISGWHFWQARQEKILNHASSVYDEMLAARAQNNMPATVVQAQKLFTHYPQTIYGQFAALMLARNAVITKNYPDAEKYLQWVIDHSNNTSFRQIARIRLARVLLAEQKPDAALNTLKTVDDKSFSGLIAEVQGDIYYSMKNMPMARQSYKQALADLPNAEAIRPLLQMKYDNITTAQSTS